MSRYNIKIRQHDNSDCGAACLVSIAAYYGYSLTIAQARKEAGTGPDGTSLLGIEKAAGKIGLEAKGVQVNHDYLPEMPLPAIAHLVREDGLHHFVVIYKATRRSVRIMDPEDGRICRIPRSSFDLRWNGILLLLSPASSFERTREKSSFTGRILSLLKPHRSLLIQALAGAALYTITGLSTAIFVQIIVDRVLVDDNRNLLNLLGLAMVVILLFRTFIGTYKSLLTIRTGQLIDVRLMLGYFHHLLHLPVDFFDRMKTGELIARLNDAVRIRAFINDALIHLSVQLFVFIFAFALMFTIYWKMALFLLLMLPVYALVYLIIDRLNRTTQRRLMEAGADLESRLVESIHNIPLIKRFSLESHIERLHESTFVSFLQTAYRSGVNNLAADTSSEFISTGFTILVLWLGSVYVLEGSLTTGELLSFYTVMGYFTQPVRELLGLNQTIQDASVAGDRLFEILDLKKEETSDDTRRRIPVSDGPLPSIRFRDVGFGYRPGQKILDSFDLTIEAGSVTALVGPSGSGKSTVGYLLQKLYRTTEGAILFGELNIDRIRTRSLRTRISAVPQNTRIMSGSIADNIAAGDDSPDLDRILNLCLETGLDDLVDNLPDGIFTRLGEQGVNLSGGERQKLSVARALYRQPGLLILDEPTSALDPESEAKIMKLIGRQSAENMTTLVIAHRLSTVVRADRICLLRKGRVTATGTHRELLKQNRHYRQLWKSSSG